MKLHIIPLLFIAGCTAIPTKMTLREGENWTFRKKYTNFELCGQARTEADAQANMTSYGRRSAWTGCWT